MQRAVKCLKWSCWLTDYIRCAWCSTHLEARLNKHIVAPSTAVHHRPCCVGVTPVGDRPDRHLSVSVRSIIYPALLLAKRRKCYCLLCVRTFHSLSIIRPGACVQQQCSVLCLSAQRAGCRKVLLGGGVYEGDGGHVQPGRDVGACSQGGIVDVL